MNTPDNCAVFACQSERFPESHVRFDGFPLVMCLIQGQYHEDIASRIEKACNSHAKLLAALRMLESAASDTLNAHPETRCCSVTRNACEAARALIERFA